MGSPRHLARAVVLLAVATAIRSAVAPSAAAAERPLGLPFALPPGPATWLLGQPYGNTTGAFRQRRTTYGASGGIHFGVDLTAPCSTRRRRHLHPLCK